MNLQIYSIKRLTRVMLVALILTGMVYGAMPAVPAHASTYLINDISDPAPGSITIDGVCDISPGDGVENCTLREAIMESNAVNDTDYITFNSVPTMTIVLTQGALPAISNPLSIDGTTSGGRVTIDGDGAAIIGLNIQSSNVSVSGLAVINFGSSAIRVSGGSDGVIINNNYLGVAPNGYTDGQNLDFGIRIVDSPNVQVTNNLISGNDAGGVIVTGAASDGVVIQGNTIGLNATRTSALEETATTGQNGLRLSDVTNATIGGSGSARNYISGNYGSGILLTGTATGTNIDGNYIGVDGVGEAAVPNLSGGVRMSSASGISIGVNQKNLISGNASSGIVANIVADLVVMNNVLGLDVDGDTIIANQGHGIVLIASSAVTVDDNVISGNTSSGVVLDDGSTNVSVVDNRIGVGEFSSASLGNSAYGIYIDNSHNNKIGGTSSGESNLIAYNGLDGVYINNSDTATYNSNGNAILRNSIYGNGGLGIDLGTNGVTSNDGGDGDTGPNTLQNFIVFTAKLTDTGVQIVGTLDTDSSRPNYRVEFYKNNSCDASGYGEGEQFLEAVEVNIVANVTALDFEITKSGVSEGQYITATVTYDEITGGLKDTSEFSPCAVVQEPDSPGSSGVFVVNSTADTAEVGGQIGDGFCNVGGNVCTLRAAIQEANTGSEPPYTISFNISGTTPHTINLTSALPSITVPVSIKGKSAGYAGAPYVIIDGTGAGGNGFTIGAGSSIIDGLSLVDFSGSAVVINASNVNVTNNYIGLLPDGTTTSGNGTGVNINGVTDVTVSGNVISGNTNGIRLVGSGAQSNVIKGNIIGLDASGVLDRGNANDGIRIEGGSLNTIGGLSVANRNVISGNNNDGIEITGGASGNKIYTNYIGVGSSGGGNLANSSYGININSSADNLVTYNNLIAYNGIAGVYVSNGNGNLISSNSIYANSSKGIALANGGNESIPTPVLTYANQGGSYIYVVGTISGAKASTQYTIEFFENSVGPQGETLIYTSQVTTDGSGNASFTAGPSGSYPDLTLITANMRDGTNNSSEFSNGVYVVGSAPVLTNTPTYTPTPSITPTATLNLRPTFTPIHTNTPVPTQTTVPTQTSEPTSTSSSASATKTPTATTGSGGSGGTAATATSLSASNTPTQTSTPTETTLPTMLPQFQTLTALALQNTVDPTSTPETPTVTLVPTQEQATATETLAAVSVEQTATAVAIAAAADGSGGGGDQAAQPQPDGQDAAQNGTSQNSQLMWILYIFGGLAVLLLVVGVGMELMRWMNSRE